MTKTIKQIIKFSEVENLTNNYHNFIDAFEVNQDMDTWIVQMVSYSGNSTSFTTLAIFYDEMEAHIYKNNLINRVWYNYLCEY